MLSTPQEPSGTFGLTHVVGDQSAVMRFLQDPASYGLDANHPIERIDTHGAAVFLAGDKAYKIKRAVCFPFMDFSTLARREEACRAEIEINRPNAPEIYIDTVAVTRDQTGKLAINGRGEPIEWAVAMHRFDRSLTFDRLAEDGLLTKHDIIAAIDAIIAFQKRAPLRRANDWIADLGSYIDQNDQAFHEAPGLFKQQPTATIAKRTQDEWKRMAALLQARGKANRVRRCHGDLHLRNIVRLPSGVRLFDAVEFDERIATGDVLYDLAFLLMALDELGMRVEANAALNHYVARMGENEDLEGLAALPLFLSIRAALRAKISAMSAQHLRGDDQSAMQQDAKRFFDYALDVLEPRDVSLTVVGGLSGTGKSSVSAVLAPTIGRAPGALVLRSDIIRKGIAKVAWTEKLEPEAYTETMTRTVYETLADMARKALASGHSVIVDAVCATAEERDMFERLALTVECHFAGVWLDAALEVRVDRLEQRRNDPSDANKSVAEAQEHYVTDDVQWPRVNANRPLADVVAKVRPLVDRLN